MGFFSKLSFSSVTVMHLRGNTLLLKTPCQDLTRPETAFMPFSQCQSLLSVVNSVKQSKQQGVFDIDINDFTRTVKTNMVVEMLIVHFKSGVCHVLLGRQSNGLQL